MRTPNNTPNHEFPQQILLRKALNMHPTIMTSSTTAKQPLGERSSNIPSPTKSPSKVPLPPSPRRVANKDAKQTTFAEETGAMDQMFRASTLLQQPELARKISEAHNNGQTYVSPSDAILSPTTKKLSDVKSRRIGYVTIHRLLRQLSNIILTSLAISKRALHCTTPRIFSRSRPRQWRAAQGTMRQNHEKT